jgi:hypothetical protein
MSVAGAPLEQLERREHWPAPVSDGDLIAAIDAMGALVKPAPIETLALWVEFLLSRYPAKADAPTFAEMDKRIWAAVLGHWPADVLEAAVTKWCGEAKRYPPSVPGELKPYGEPIIAARQVALWKLKRMLAAPPIVAIEEDRDASALLATLRKSLALAPTRARPALTERFRQPPPQQPAAEGEGARNV